MTPITPQTNTPTNTVTPSIDKAVAVLNDLLESDPKALEELLKVRVDVNPATAEAKFLFCQPKREGHCLGIIGLINGLLQAVTGDRVAMIVDNVQCVGFTRLPKK